MAPKLKDSQERKVSKASKVGFFPKISRFITEEWKMILSSLASGILIFGIVWQSISLYQALMEEKRINSERENVERELDFWRSEAEKYPGHRDIFFKIATLEYRLGNKDEARINLDKALIIDPNFEKGREMEKEMEI